jgi:hypothetical protein
VRPSACSTLLRQRHRWMKSALRRARSCNRARLALEAQERHLCEAHTVRRGSVRLKTTNSRDSNMQERFLRCSCR